MLNSYFILFISNLVLPDSSKPHEQLVQPLAELQSRRPYRNRSYGRQPLRVPYVSLDKGKHAAYQRAFGLANRCESVSVPLVRIVSVWERGTMQSCVYRSKMSYDERGGENGKRKP